MRPVKEVAATLGPVLGSAFLGALLVWVLALAVSVVRPCPYEDSTYCSWDASERGNGRGDSFVMVGPWQVRLP